ncbi:MAG: hypothetical protein OXE82_00630, partial [Rhodobacter sp.]|nr:hypothetical protein [Rhodobacter sp.]
MLPITGVLPAEVGSSTMMSVAVVALSPPTSITDSGGSGNFLFTGILAASPVQSGRLAGLSDATVNVSFGN